MEERGTEVLEVSYLCLLCNRVLKFANSWDHPEEELISVSPAVQITRCFYGSLLNVPSSLSDGRDDEDNFKTINFTACV